MDPFSEAIMALDEQLGIALKACTLMQASIDALQDEVIRLRGSVQGLHKSVYEIKEQLD